MNLNELRDEAYRIACEHGWHEKEYTEQHWIMLVITEISEAVNADRRNRHTDKLAFEHDTMNALREKHLYGEAFENYERSCFNAYIKDTVEDEFADVVIRILDLSGLYAVDLDMMPNAFKVYDSDTDRLLRQYIESVSMNEFAYSCTLRTVDICEHEISWGDIQCLLHRIYIYSIIKGFDLEWHVRQKMHYNESRPYKHGKNY